MYQPRMRLLFCSASIFFLAISGFAQGTRTDQSAMRNSNVVRGKIFMPNGSFPERRIRVVLEISSGGVAADTFSDSVGNFEFRSLAQGNYRVVVPSDGHTFEAGQEGVEISGAIARTYSVQVYLREKRSAQQDSPEKMISAFVQDVPKDARKKYEQGAKKLKEGKTEEAFTSLQAALKDFPDYVMAHDKLGQYYLNQQKFTEAQAEFERAIAINDKYALSHVNLGMLLTVQKRFDDAIAHLEAANRLDETYPMAHLYLGLALLEKSAQQPDKLESAERSLQRAITLGGNGMAQAHKYIFNIHFRQKEYEKAANDLAAYLNAAPAAPDAPQVKEVLAKLRKQIAEAKTK